MGLVAIGYAVKTRAQLDSSRHQTGFTLIEILVVITIISIVLAASALALRVPANDEVARTAERLGWALEAAALEARAGGVPVAFSATPSGYAFIALRAPTKSTNANNVGSAWSEVASYATRLGETTSASGELGQTVETPVWQSFSADHPLKSVRLNAPLQLAALRIDGVDVALGNELGAGVVRWFGNDAPVVELLVRDPERGTEKRITVGKLVGRVQ